MNKAINTTLLLVTLAALMLTIQGLVDFNKTVYTDTARIMRGN